MRLFDLVRDEDVSGVSGTGVVAEVCEFENGWAAVAFLKHTAGIGNVIVYSDISHVHGTRRKDKTRSPRQLNNN